MQWIWAIKPLIAFTCRKIRNGFGCASNSYGFKLNDARNANSGTLMYVYITQCVFKSISAYRIVASNGESNNWFGRNSMWHVHAYAVVAGGDAGGELLHIYSNNFFLYLFSKNYNFMLHKLYLIAVL